MDLKDLRLGGVADREGGPASSQGDRVTLLQAQSYVSNGDHDI